MRSLAAAAALLASVTLAACSGSSTSTPSSDEFPAAPYATVPSEAGKARIEVRTAPDQPPTHGVISVQLTVFDAASGAPVDGLSVDVQPWMAAMGHGSSVKPTVTAAGSGRYVARNVNAFMPGRWELRTTISGSIEDRATPVLDVP